MAKYALFIAAIIAVVVEGNNERLPCDSDIYCYGDLLQTVQEAKIFEDMDSKTFVDMPLKYEPQIVKENFQSLVDKYGRKPSKDQIRKFVDDNFRPAGSEFEEWIPEDWKSCPLFLNKIVDPNLREFGKELNSFWKQLGRRISSDVKTRQELYSMIYVNNPVVVPGGRFREFYYWDQYWILKGLLHCEMTSSVRGMLENFIQMVDEIGYIPNGGRIYYRRSQPPLLIPMVKDYLDFTNNVTFLQKNVASLDKEFEFWMRNRNYSLELDGKVYTVIRYNVELGGPRPESYIEDYELASKLTSPDEQEELYENLKSAAESGIDFSYRWFLPEDASAIGTLKDTKARDIIPVDLNVLIMRNARILQQFHEQLGNANKARSYEAVARSWETTINAVFWNETIGSWFDYVTLAGRRGHKTEFFPGNILPLISGLPSMTSKTTKVLAYLEREKVLSFEGGIPSSLEQTEQQWDYPNAWAPHNHWFIESLEATGNTDARRVAAETAQKWVANNFLTYRTHNNTMFEKYDAAQPGSYGGGGEYAVVVGFGWSNGVVLDLLDKYGQTLTAPPVPPNM